MSRAFFITKLLLGDWNNSSLRFVSEFISISLLILQSVPYFHSQVNQEEGLGPRANSPCKDKSPTDPNSRETTPLSSVTQETPEEKSPSPQSSILQLDPPEDSKKKEKKGFLAKTKGFSLFKKLGR
jgi:hypothetical protein